MPLVVRPLDQHAVIGGDAHVYRAANHVDYLPLPGGLDVTEGILPFEALRIRVTSGEQVSLGADCNVFEQLPTIPSQDLGIIRVACDNASAANGVTCNPPRNST